VEIQNRLLEICFSRKRIKRAIAQNPLGGNVNDYKFGYDELDYDDWFASLYSDFYGNRSWVADYILPDVVIDWLIMCRQGKCGLTYGEYYLATQAPWERSFVGRFDEQIEMSQMDPEDYPFRGLRQAPRTQRRLRRGVEMPKPRGATSRAKRQIQRERDCWQSRNATNPKVNHRRDGGAVHPDDYKRHNPDQWHPSWEKDLVELGLSFDEIERTHEKYWEHRNRYESSRDEDYEDVFWGNELVDMNNPYFQSPLG
jgi:hypothetical protein